MTINAVSVTRHAQWAQGYGAAINIGTVKRGDLVILLNMSSSGPMVAPIGYTTAWSYSNTSLMIYFKKITQDGTEKTSSVSASGALYSVILRSDRGNIDVFKHGGLVGSITSSLFNNIDSGWVLSTTGNSNSTQFSGYGWKTLFQTSWPNSDYYNLAIKEFKSGGITIPSYPYWGGESYLVIKEDVDAQIYIAYSDNGTDFSEYELFNSTAIKQHRFVKFKAVITSYDANVKKIEHQFDTTDPEFQFNLNEFLERAGTDIKLKTVYSEPFVQDSGNEKGKLFKVEVNKLTWKNINKLKVKE